ncbi:MAG: hypothetical protein OEM38_09750 [Gammaproteobacteria bacterium]|nr:hypothetical protein [Gammaproteobacteria bacterium]
MSKLEKQYKSLPLKSRMEMALSETVMDGYRPLLAVDQWNVIRCYFSRRADLSLAEIAIMIEDDDYVIRLSIAKRNDLSLEQIEKCVIDADPNVRHAIARNTLLSDKHRKVLLDDDDDLVRRSASKGPRHAQYRQRVGQARLIR